jgi:hypothetical protein
VREEEHGDPISPQDLLKQWCVTRVPDWIFYEFSQFCLWSLLSIESWPWCECEHSCRVHSVQHEMRMTERGQHYNWLRRFIDLQEGFRKWFFFFKNPV